MSLHVAEVLGVVLPAQELTKPHVMEQIKQIEQDKKQITMSELQSTVEKVLTKTTIQDIKNPVNQEPDNDEGDDDDEDGDTNEEYAPLTEAHGFVADLWDAATSEEKARLADAQIQFQKQKENAQETAKESGVQNAGQQAASSGHKDESKKDVVQLPQAHECGNILCITPKGSKPLMPCSRCRQAFYCSKECQTADWKKQHKTECRLAMQKVLESPAPVSSLPTVSSSGSSNGSEKPPLTKEEQRRQELKGKVKGRKVMRQIQARGRKTGNADVAGRYMETHNNITQLMQNAKQDADIGEGLKAQTGNMNKLFQTLMTPQHRQAISSKLPADMKPEHKQMVDNMLGRKIQPTKSEKPVKHKKKKAQAQAEAQESATASRIVLPPSDD